MNTFIQIATGLVASTAWLPLLLVTNFNACAVSTGLLAVLWVTGGTSVRGRSSQ